MDDNTIISPERVLEELVAIGFAKVTDYLYVHDGVLTLKELPPEAGAAVAAIERTANGPKVKLYDKLKALELLGKYMGIFEGKGNRQQGGKNNLLDAILAAAGKEVSADDIPELQQAAADSHDLVEQSTLEGF